MAVCIYFHPHGTTFDNEQEIASGHSDAALSPLGVEQAGALGERFRDTAFAAVFCSDLQRARHTAELAFGHRAIPICVDARLRECDYGALNGHPRGEVEALRLRCINVPFPSGESYAEVAARVCDFLTDMARDYPDGHLMVIGHSATMWSLEHLVNGVLLEEALSIPVVSRLGAEYEVFPAKLPRSTGLSS